MIFLSYFRKLASDMVNQRKFYHRLYRSATYGQDMKGIQVMGKRAAWKQEKSLPRFMSPQTVIFSLLSVICACTCIFCAILNVHMTQMAQCQETQSCLHNMLFTRATMSPSQGSEKQNYLSIHFYESFFLFKLCYQSEIKELLIACVFKFGLEMLSKLDYLK